MFNKIELLEMKTIKFEMENWLDEPSSILDTTEKYE